MRRGKRRQYDWKITASGPDGRSTVDEVEGACEHTLVEIVELFEQSSQQDMKGVVRSRREVALNQAEDSRHPLESRLDAGMRAVDQLIKKTLNGE